MGSFGFSRQARCICAAATLAGCGGLQSGVGVPGLAPQTFVARGGHAGSWIAPTARSHDLLYVTDQLEVHVFSYPRGKYEGTLIGFLEAIGTCVDQDGNVYIADQGYNRLFE